MTANEALAIEAIRAAHRATMIAQDYTFYLRGERLSARGTARIDDALDNLRAVLREIERNDDHDTTTTAPGCDERLDR